MDRAGASTPPSGTRPITNVYDLDDLAFVRLLLTPAIGLIEGAKVFGPLYASSDDEQKSVYAIDLDTGMVMKRFTLGTPKSEAEGLALTRHADGARMHVLNVVIPNVDFVEYLWNAPPAARQHLPLNVRHSSPVNTKPVSHG